MSADTDLDNWGRWGGDDALGTLNLIDDAARQRAVAAVRSGRSVSLAKIITPSPLVSGPYGPTPVGGAPVQQILNHIPPFFEATSDVLIVTNHHPQSTHLDALCHQGMGGMVYPGTSLNDSVGLAGVSHGSTTAFAAGILTRGVLFDLATEGPLAVDRVVTGADLDAAEGRAGVTVEPGDALVVRGDWDIATKPAVPGIGLDAVRWIHARGVSIYLGDLSDARPIAPGTPSPLHKIALVKLGLPLVDVCDLRELAAVCAELGRWSFMLTLAPPRIHDLTGVPVNPLAVF